MDKGVRVEGKGAGEDGDGTDDEDEDIGREDGTEVGAGMATTNSGDRGTDVRGTVVDDEEGDNGHGGGEMEVGSEASDDGEEVIAGTEMMKDKWRKKGPKGRARVADKEAEVGGGVVEEAGGSCCGNGRGRQLTGKRRMAEHGAARDGRRGSKEDSRRRRDLEPLESIKDSRCGKGIMVKDLKGWGWWGGPSGTGKGRQIRKRLKG